MNSLSSRYALLAALALIVGGCNRGMQTKEAVERGVTEYLATRSNLNVTSMNVAVTSVVFRQNEADAVVTFRAKGENPGPGMDIRYTLERNGGKWVVKNKADSAGNPHGAPSKGMGEPGMSAPGAPAGELPAGHPPMGSIKQ